MRNPLSSKITSIKPSGIRKFFDIVATMKDAISLGVGEPDFDTPYFIRDEAIYSLEKGRTFYTSNSGLHELREEINKYLQRKLNISYNPDDEIIVTVGGSEGIDIAMRAMLDTSDEVLIPQPSYVSYEPCVLLTGAKPVIIELKSENEFKLTKNQILEKLSPRTKLLVLPFPNNPTGSIMNYDELKEIANVCIENDLYVISDEIYCELTYKGKHVSIAQIDGMKERTIIINGFSKSYAMTGWRLGYACGPKSIIQQMTKIHQFAIMCAPTTSQYAAIEALKFGDEAVAKMRDSYNQRRRYCINRLNSMGLDCFEAQGAFYVFPSIKAFNISSEEFASKLLKEKRVAIIPGTAFGASGEGFMRISYAYSIERLKEAFDRLENFVEKLRCNSV